MKAPQTSSDLVRTYLKEIGRVPLLTHEQEVVYGKQVQKLVALQARRTELRERLDREPTNQEWAEAAELSADEVTQAMDAGELAKRRMVEANLRLVVTVAKK